MFCAQFVRMSDVCRTCKPSLGYRRELIPFKIQEAAKKGHNECMEILLQIQDILSSSPDACHTTLVEAVRKGQFELVKLLFRCGPWFFHDLQQPFSEAVYHGHIDIMKFIIASAANDEGQTPLTLALIKEDENMVKAALEAGADVNRINQQTGQTALMEVALKGCAKIAILLLEAGADVNELDTIYYRNKLDFESQAALAYCALKDSEKSVRKLLAAGVDVNRVNESGDTALIVDAQKGYLKDNGKGVRMLVELGADVNKVGESGDTALIVAVRNGHLNITKALPEAGADVNKVGESGVTALMIAAQKGCLNISKALIEAGADVNKIPRDNKTALMYFALSGNTEGLRLLLRSGAKVNIGCEPVGTLKLIIRLLLRAAGQEMVTLQRNNESPDDTLHHRCRETIRRHLLKLDPHENLFFRIPRLGLPSRLAKYLLYDTSLDENGTIQHEKNFDIYIY